MLVFLFLAFYLLTINLLIKNNGWKVYLSAIGFFVVLALRSPFCGIDLLSSETHSTMSYYGYFDRLSYVSLGDFLSDHSDFYFEFGFLLFTKIITLFTSDFQIYIAIVALVELIPIVIFFRKYSLNITLSFFVYGCLSLFIFSFSGLRQTMAISFTVMALDCLIREKKWQFWLWVLLAISFHTSALSFILVWFVKKKKLELRQCLVLIAVILLLMPFQRSIIPVISNFFFGARYNYYDQGGALTMVFVYTAFLLISYMTREETPLLHLFRWLCLFAVFFQSFGFISTGALTRIAYYFVFYFAMLLPMVVANIDNIPSRKVVVLIVETLFCVFFFVVNRGGYLNVVPYKFLWETPALY